MANITVKPIRLQTINDEYTYYVRIMDEKGKMATIRIGEKNYNEIKAMLPETGEEKIAKAKEGGVK